MTAAIDLPTFEALQQTAGADFVGELIGTFLSEAPTMRADLRSALAAKDAERFRRAAHSLKSNCNTFGALTLGQMAKALELGGLGATGNVQALEALDAEYARVASALKELRDA
jgi:HPt (histidine-containing phosphotransfer) domain-containing protein